MDEETRILDLVNNPTPAMVAAYFYRMYPDDYTWRRYGSMFTRGWSGIDTWGRESSETREEGALSKVQWRHYGTQPVGLMLRVARTMMDLVRPMMDSNPKARAAYIKFGMAGFTRRVIAELRALYAQN
jgi:hypothetical protein